MDISKYIGIPFKDKGRDMQGLDCWGLIWLVYRDEFGVELPSYTEEYVTAYDWTFIKSLIQKERESDTWRSIEKDFEKEGDVILFRIKGAPCHIGIVTRMEYMAHVWDGINVCIERYTKSIWYHRMLGFYRYVAR